MKNIGIKNIDLFHFFGGTNLKKDLLYFDKILIDEDHYKLFTGIAHSWKNVLEKYKRDYSLHEIEFLEKEGLLEIVNIRDYYRKLGGDEELGLIKIEVDLNEIQKNFLKYETEERIQKVF